jgi:hypothetical protein
MLILLAAMLFAFPPQKPEGRGLLIAGTDMFWETFDEEFYNLEDRKLPNIPSEKQAVDMLRLRGFTVYE